MANAFLSNQKMFLIGTIPMQKFRTLWSICDDFDDIWSKLSTVPYHKRSCLHALHPLWDPQGNEITLNIDYPPPVDFVASTMSTSQVWRVQTLYMRVCPHNLQQTVMINDYNHDYERDYRAKVLVRNRRREGVATVKKLPEINNIPARSMKFADCRTRFATRMKRKQTIQAHRLQYIIKAREGDRTSEK